MKETPLPQSAPRWLDDEQQRSWRGLAALLHVLPAALDRQLQEEAGMPHAYYMILAMLSEAPDRSMRMARLAHITSTSASRLSHAIARLQERGWVERHQCATDKRGQVASLTEAGWQAVQTAAPSHVAEVRRLVFDRLTPEQVTQLRDISDRILSAVAGDEESR